MWESIATPWKVSFEEAWEAYCNGSLPIGAVLVDSKEQLKSRARNRINEMKSPEQQTCNNKLAHAELNVLLQMDNTKRILPDDILYTTTEPCVLCFGAIVMSGVRRVRYAAKDPLAGGASLNKSNHTLIKERGIEIVSAPHELGIIQRVIRIEFVLRYLDKMKAERLLAFETVGYESAYELAQKWYANGRLQKAKHEEEPIGTIVDSIYTEIKL
jgi:tRNA(adenine34) deaminase